MNTINNNISKSHCPLLGKINPNKYLAIDDFKKLSTTQKVITVVTSLFLSVMFIAPAIFTFNYLVSKFQPKNPDRNIESSLSEQTLHELVSSTLDQERPMTQELSQADKSDNNATFDFSGESTIPEDYRESHSTTREISHVDTTEVKDPDTSEVSHFDNSFDEVSEVFSRELSDSVEEEIACYDPIFQMTAEGKEEMVVRLEPKTAGELEEEMLHGGFNIPEEIEEAYRVDVIAKGLAAYNRIPAERRQNTLVRNFIRFMSATMFQKHLERKPEHTDYNLYLIRRCSTFKDNPRFQLFSIDFLVNKEIRTAHNYTSTRLAVYDSKEDRYYKMGTRMIDEYKEGHCSKDRHYHSILALLSDTENNPFPVMEIDEQDIVDDVNAAYG